ncbi:MAG TPA: hypothetical protein VK581_14135 [Chthoniobacterales bacterium]|nr:hypothetical protein [Chthoniobacterales bacterium]
MSCSAFANIGSQFLDADGNIRVDLMPDDVHPSAKGYALWDRALELIFSEMLK